MRVAVTGASGFVGRHVVQALTERGIDPVTAGRAPAKGAARHVQFDLHDPPQDAFDRLGRPDILIHLAWTGLPNFKSLHHFESELPAQYRFLRGLVAAGLPRLVVSGTCFEYGMQSGELSEEMEARPANPYALAKNVLRKQLEALRAQSPFELTWMRFFYMYGAGQAPTSLYTLVQKALAAGAASFDMSAGEQLRDFLPVEELAAAVADLALQPRGLGLVNVCSGRPVSVRSLVERWVAESGKSLKLNLGKYPYPDYEPLAFWGSARRLREILGR